MGEGSPTGNPALEPLKAITVLNSGCQRPNTTPMARITCDISSNEMIMNGRTLHVKSLTAAGKLRVFQVATLHKGFGKLQKFRSV